MSSTPLPHDASLLPQARLSRCLAVAFLAVAVSLLLGEGAVRLLGIDSPSRETGIAPHPLWHHWHRPDFSFEYQVAAEGYQKRVRFNAHGMRESRPIELTKPPGLFRVAVIGDSFVEAMQVEEAEGVTQRLAAHLQATSGQRPEVLNFGCSGFSSTLELVQLREWVLGFAPDVVICLHHFSDITEDWRLTALTSHDGQTVRAVQPTGQGKGRQLRRFLEASQLFRVAGGALDRCRRHRPPPPDASLQESFDAIVHDPYTPEDEQAWANSLRAVADMATLLQSQRIPFLLVLIPLGTQVEPVPAAFAARTGLRYLAEGRRLEYRGYQQKVTAFCQAKGIACLDLLETFRAANPEGRPWLYLQYDQHWSSAGHDLAAKSIALRLLPLRRASQDRWRDIGNTVSTAATVSP